MHTLTEPTSEQPISVSELAADIQWRHRTLIRELHIELVEGGIILHGRAMTFYGKQIAFHEVSCRCRLVVVANRLEVQERPAKANAG